MAKDEKIDNLSFEQALTKLETLVRKMETGEAGLEESIAYYEDGMALKVHCEKKLSEAKMRVDKIVVSKNGAITTQSFDNQE